MDNNKKCNLKSTLKLLENIGSLLPPNCSVKCLIDDEKNYELTRNGLKYIQSYHASNNWIVDILTNYCSTFVSTHSFGSTEFFVTVKLWISVFLDLIEKDIPSFIACRILPYFIARSCRNIFQNHKTKMKKFISDNMQFPSYNTHTASSLKPSSVAVKYNKYSRHIIKDAQSDLMENNRAKFLKCIARQIKKICENRSEVINKLLLQLVELKTKNISSFTEFYFVTENVNIEGVLNHHGHESQAYTGISLEIKETDDVSLFTDTDNINVLLIDLDFHGGELPGKDSLKIKEEISISEYESHTQSTIEKVNKFCLRHNVSFLLVRGHISNDTKLKFSPNRISILNCDFDKMSRLSKHLSCSICYGFDDVISTEAIGNATARILYKNDKRKHDGKRFSHKQSSQAILLLSNETSVNIFYTVFLCGTTSDLLHLNVEEFHDCLMQASSLFSDDDGFIQNPGIVYNDIINLSKSRDMSFANVFSPWQQYDADIYKKPILDVLAVHFKRFVEKHSVYTSKPVSQTFLYDIFDISVVCVIEILNTQEYPLIIEPT